MLVQPGQSLVTSNIVLNSTNTVGVYLELTVGSRLFIGSNAGHEGEAWTVPDYTHTNPSTNTVPRTVKLLLNDNTHGVNYFSTGTSEYTYSGSTVNHTTLGYSKGQVMVSINDTGPDGQYRESAWQPTLGEGVLNMLVKVRKR